MNTVEKFNKNLVAARTKLVNLVSLTQKWSLKSEQAVELADSLVSIVNDLEAVREKIEHLVQEQGWQPPSIRGPSVLKSIKEGDHVFLKAAARKTFAAVYSEEVLASLEVLEIVENGSTTEVVLSGVSETVPLELLTLRPRKSRK